MSDSYYVGEVLPGNVLENLPAGTNVLIMGPSMAGKRDLALQLLATGYEAGDGILCITTEGAKTIYNDLEGRIDPLDRNRVGIIDTSGSDGQELLHATTESVSSPSDLTGISMGTAKLFQHFEKRSVSEIRYGLISISTLLQYLDSQKVFKFLHIYNQRINNTDGLGIYTLDSDTHDDQLVNTISGQFDGIIELREIDASELQFRVRGFGNRPTEWTEY